MGEVHRLREIIIDQKREIQRLQEKLLTYEKEPCADRLIKGCDSGGSRSLLAGAEEFVARNVNTTRDGISNNGKMPWISSQFFVLRLNRYQWLSLAAGNDNARVTINICAGSIAYNHYNSNSTPVMLPSSLFVIQFNLAEYSGTSFCYSKLNQRLQTSQLRS
ncbi:hypothetical protein BVRB_035170 [Beta vulgaris subsp. vulgaris]|uniref:Uncharacterized protein n=1 Tax=Beta vulgaris subsp. vulgaris TaxID=3555 RepID=A0A0J7YQW1_BETVV|nr:hypothetical protein BVRB_035170 [Beta vulgaris subsp. vulgaris]